MITFLLYIITAISTAWQLSQQILMGVWGKPSNPIEHVAFLGSLIFLVSAYAALFSLRRAAWISITASVLLWIYYVPASINTIAGTVSGQYILEPLALIPMVLLGFATGVSIWTLFKAKTNNNSYLLKAAPKKFRQWVFVLTGLLILFIIVAETFFVGVDREITTPVNWTIEQEGNRAIVKMTFQKLEGFGYIETDSKEVIAYLQKNNPRDVAIRVSLTYDFGKVQSLNLNYAYLGNIKFVPNIDTNP